MWDFRQKVNYTKVPNGDSDQSDGDLNRQSILSFARQLWRFKIILGLGLVSLVVMAFVQLDAIPSVTNREELSVQDESAYVPTKDLVVASSKKQDIQWMEQLEGWSVRRYVYDDIAAELSVPRNQGNEAMTYLTYIINNYHNLPDYVAFIHGHETGWHQVVSMPILLRALNLTMVEEQGFATFRCGGRGCTKNDFSDTNYDGNHKAKKMFRMFREYHKYLFRPQDTWYRPEIPDRLKPSLGAQFVVTKAAILNEPLDFWIRARRPLTRDFSELKVWWNSTAAPNSWQMGVLFEHSWPYLFRQPLTECPSVDECFRTLFQDQIRCDNFEGDWDGGKYLGPANCTFLGDVKPADLVDFIDPLSDS